ncbi:MAG TPA: glycoside hydrolase family 15 protein, partial [Thermoanaerobaculia bacterium]|nr:glycoside hydrolase family 15 protein [Thermoanaerobaculia bacterium]
MALCTEGEVGSTEDALHLRDQTVWSWVNWTKSCSVPGFHPEAVVRSALCLKLHQYAPTGAIIASATTSIPEEMGTGRTWDYRYCWLRDSALVVEALRRLGCIAEGERFLLYLRDIAGSGPLQPVYGVAGERALVEEFLPHLAGFRGNGHVRIGNAASGQVQHDVPGELLLSMRAMLLDPRTSFEVGAFRELTGRLVDEADKALFRPDSSIWEKRSEPAVHTFSQALCWAALDSGARLAEVSGRSGDQERWQRRADQVRPEMLRRAYNRDAGMFTETFDGRLADAAILLLPMVGFVSARSEEFRSTCAAYERELVVEGLMKRYRHHDDFGVPRSVFTICSFWWAEALALAGDLDRAIEVFERLLGYANAHGLYSEDIDPATHEMLGNFPQAYTHVGLINAAITIGLLEAVRDERIAPWR